MTTTHTATEQDRYTGAMDDENLGQAPYGDSRSTETELDPDELKRRLEKSENEYNSLKGRLAPTQRKLDEAEAEIARLRQENEALASYRERYEDLDNEAGDLLLRKKVEEQILASYTPEEREEIDPLLLKGLVEAGVASAKAARPRAPKKEKTVEHQQQTKYTQPTGASNPIDDVRQSYLSDGESSISRAVTLASDPELVAYIERNPELKEALGDFSNSTSIAAITKAARKMEREFDKFFSSKHPVDKAPRPKDLEDVSPTVQTGGVSRHASRKPMSADQVARKVADLHQRAKELSRSGSLEKRREAKKLLDEADKILAESRQD